MRQYLSRHPWSGAVLVTVLLAVGANLVGCVPAADAAPIVTSTTVVAAGDSIRVTVSFTLRGADSVRYSVSSTNGRPAAVQSSSAATGALVFLLLGPAEGETDTVTVTPTAYKARQAFAQPAITRTITRGVTPPPIVTDSVTVEQVAAALGVGHPLGHVLVLGLAGDTCAGEWQDYYGMLMLGTTAAPSTPCATRFEDRSAPARIGALNVIAVRQGDSARARSAAFDSLWRAGRLVNPALALTVKSANGVDVASVFRAANMRTDPVSSRDVPRVPTVADTVNAWPATFRQDWPATTVAVALDWTQPMTAQP